MNINWGWFEPWSGIHCESWSFAWVESGGGLSLLNDVMTNWPKRNLQSQVLAIHQDPPSFLSFPSWLMHYMYKSSFALSYVDFVELMRSKRRKRSLLSFAHLFLCLIRLFRYYYFAIQGYGECWAGLANQTYDKHGHSDNCHSRPGLGGQLTNFVYKFTDV